MSAKIDATQWTAVTTTASKGPVLPGLPNGILGISGTGSATNQILVVAFSVPAALGAYQLGPNGPAANPPNASVTNSATGAQWNATSSSGSGSITVSGLTTTGAIGTFSFTLTAVTGTAATGTRVVTDGSFSVTF
jgi:hypothetical protein